MTCVNLNNTQRFPNQIIIYFGIEGYCNNMHARMKQGESFKGKIFHKIFWNNCLWLQGSTKSETEDTLAGKESPKYRIRLQRSLCKAVVLTVSCSSHYQAIMPRILSFTFFWLFLFGNGLTYQLSYKQCCYRISNSFLKHKLALHKVEKKATATNKMSPLFSVLWIYN